MLPAFAALSITGLCAFPLHTAYAQSHTGPAPIKAAVTPTPKAGTGTPAAPGSGATPTPVSGPAPVAPPTPTLTILTQRNDNARDGVNYLEKSLYPPTGTAPTTLPVGAPKTFGLVGQTTFGLLFTRTMDGPSYTQPLYLSNLPLVNPSTRKTSTHNVVITTTNNNSVYCFDADNNIGANGGPLWHASFNLPNNQAVPTSGSDITDIFGLPERDIQPLIGIVGTPVIDGATNTLYVVVRTTEGTNYYHRLHAIDITTGLERFYSPQLIGQQEDNFGNVTPVIVPGNGDNLDGKGNVYFDLLNENQRPALTLINGTIYVAYGSFENSPPYHGWLFAFNASNFNATGVFNTSPNAISSFNIGSPAVGAGIDMGGSGLAADSTGVYFSTGDGIFNANTGGTEYGESILKVGLKSIGAPPPAPYLPSLPVLSFFTPYNNSSLSLNDIDLGKGGIALLPDNIISGHPHTLVTAGSEGKIYLLDRDTMGGFHAGSDAGAITTIPNAVGPVQGAPAVYTSIDPLTQAKTTTIFFHGTGDVVRGFTVSSGAPYLNPLPVAGKVKYDTPGAMPVISSNNGSNGIIWELEGRKTQYPDPTYGGIQNQRPFAVLHAYDATTLTQLFASSANGGGANIIGDFINNTMPTVANGKVYVTGGIPSQFDPGNGGPISIPSPAPIGVPPTQPQGRLCVFGPVTTPPQTQSYHYQLSGPVGWAATSFGQSPLIDPLPVYPAPQLVANPAVGVINVSRPNYYSITAVDSNNNVVNVTTSVHIFLVNANTGASATVANVNFTNQSNIVIPLTINTPGAYRMVVQDANGNSSQDNPLFPGNLGFNPGVGGIAGLDDRSYIIVIPSVQAGFDHFSIRSGPAVRDGVPTTISITPTNSHGIPLGGYASIVMIYDTLPGGVQDYSLPADANPTDGFGPTNSLTEEPLLTPHALNLTTGVPDVTPNKFAYEFQYGICDFALVPGDNIGINDFNVNLFGPYGSNYPTAYGTGTYPCIFHGVGQHVVVVEDFITGTMSTIMVNVVSSSGPTAPVRGGTPGG